MTDSTQVESLGHISSLGGLDLHPALPMCHCFPGWSVSPYKYNLIYLCLNA